MIVINRKDMMTATVIISLFTGHHASTSRSARRWPPGVMVTIPLVIVVLLFQRRIVAGLTAGGVK